MEIKTILVRIKKLYYLDMNFRNICKKLLPVRSNYVPVTVLLTGALLRPNGRSQKGVSVQND